ncbi:nuclear transport factor 2 family protein [Phyllobacterium myrsinacearum]|uniref:Putative SnoaL-like aldol condensation-catalyzing enzyme n=1 Tax=Phyllobacterium myrsinacearum TaxID=28101 RepID=A0A839ER20_9HYPH|nr:ester cyclase [Phyllobacterium myrsinacearum]MBA8881252.1 putative SnoaL-like aldol condensation-catalyzing enzyme [Phyllobacterium myrsinacearum]
MKSFIALAFLIAITGTGTAYAQRVYSPEELRNKQIVLDFYEKGLNQKDFEAASKYLGTYIQHNPNAADGPEGFRKFIEFLKKDFPQSRSKITQVLVDGDFVTLRVHTTREPETRGSAIIDIFRLKDGKIEEHWDSVQPIPEKSMNNNTMF